MYDFRFGRIMDLSHPQARIRDINVRFQHTYILGPPGVGKTSLMLRMALTDILCGCSCIFIDPKGEHVKSLYNLIPDKEKIIYFSLNNPSLIINPLRKQGYRLDDLIDEFLEILDIVTLQTSSNPVLSDNMKELIAKAVKELREEDRDIENLLNFLRYSDFRREYLGRKHSEYWEEVDKKNAGKMSDESATAKRLAIRLNKFVEDERFLKIVKGENQLDIEKITDNQNVILIDTSGMSDDKKTYVVSLFSCAIKSYMNFQKPSIKKPLMFYFDECFLGINESFTNLMPLGRSYKIGFTLAHQEINQFKNQKTLKNLTGNCSTKIAFRQSDSSGAKLMANDFGLKNDDFINLPDYEAWVRIKNQNSWVKTWPAPIPEKKDDIDEVLENTENFENDFEVCFLNGDIWFSC
ncbi:MAG: type IV secretion system DNA-binding domain-containing protein [Desulfobacteraceae bacterium]|jgi:type IV secretory pathway VirB4 component